MKKFKDPSKIKGKDVIIPKNKIIEKRIVPVTRLKTNRRKSG